MAQNQLEWPTILLAIYRLVLALQLRSEKKNTRIVWGTEKEMTCVQAVRFKFEPDVWATRLVCAWPWPPFSGNTVRRSPSCLFFLAPRFLSTCDASYSIFSLGMHAQNIVVHENHHNRIVYTLANLIRRLWALQPSVFPFNITPGTG